MGKIGEEVRELEVEVIEWPVVVPKEAPVADPWEAEREPVPV